MISVIIPAYNSEKYIGNCIMSILSQTYKNYELIIIDNNSTDNTARIIKKLSTADSRIKYVFCAEKGVSNARNEGIKNASGDYIFFMDSDDSILPYMLETLYNTAVKENADITACNILYSQKKSKPFPMEKKQPSVTAFKEKIPSLFYDMLPSYVWYMVFKLFKKKLLMDNNISFSACLKIGEDLEFVINSLAVSSVVSFVDTPFYIYNVSSEGLNLKYHNNLYMQKSILFNNIKTYLIKNSQPLENLYKNLINDIFSLLVNETKSSKPDFNKIFNFELTNELIKSDIFKHLSLSKKIFFLCLKYKLNFILFLMTKIWIKG